MVLLLQYTLIFASVLMLVALGGCFAERSGVINIGLEGIMVIGALGGALVLKFLPVTVGTPVMVLSTVVVSALFGSLFSLFLAVAAINFKADQTIIGTAMNMLATAGATVAVKAMNTAASGGNDVSSEIAYTQTKDLLLVRFGGFSAPQARPCLSIYTWPVRTGPETARDAGKVSQKRWPCLSWSWLLEGLSRAAGVGRQGRQTFGKRLTFAGAASRP